MDLLNGPQDMGWCFGYTCQERISTFYSLVSPSRVYEMHFTGTPPQHLRFHFLNAEPDMVSGRARHGGEGGGETGRPVRGTEGVGSIPAAARLQRCRSLIRSDHEQAWAPASVVAMKKKLHLVLE